MNAKTSGIYLRAAASARGIGERLERQYWREMSADGLLAASETGRLCIAAQSLAERLTLEAKQ